MPLIYAKFEVFVRGHLVEGLVAGDDAGTIDYDVDVSAVCHGLFVCKGNYFIYGANSFLTFSIAVMLMSHIMKVLAPFSRAILPIITINPSANIWQ